MFDRFQNPVNDRFLDGEPFFQYYQNEIREVKSENGHYFVRLSETPSKKDDGAPGNITISGLTESKNKVLKTGEFRPTYTNSTIYFHQSMAGQSVAVNYYGRGSAVDADHVLQKVDKYAHTLVVYNSSGSTILKGKGVKPTGGLNTTMGVPQVNLVSSLTDFILGIVKEDIGTGEFGEIISFGYILTTVSGATLGGDIYLDASGNLTSTETDNKVGKGLGTGIVLVNINLLNSGSGGSSQYDWFILDQIKQTYG